MRKPHSLATPSARWFLWRGRVIKNDLNILNIRNFIMMFLCWVFSRNHSPWMLKSSNAPGVAKEVLSHATLGWAGHPYPQAASGPETWLQNPQDILRSLPWLCCLKVLPSEFLCVFILHRYHTFVEKREYGDMTTSSFLDPLKCIFASKIWIVQKIHEPWRLPPARRWWCMVRFTVFGAC